MRQGIEWSPVAIGVTISSYSLVCAALRGKLGVFSEMETNFKVCDPVRFPPKCQEPSVFCPCWATLLMPEIDQQVALLLSLCL